MQETENEQTTPTLPTSQPLASVPIVQVNENDGDPDEIFLNAVAEIDTQPLVKVKQRRAGTFTIGGVLEIAFLVTVLCGGLVGSIYLAITYPHTLVILYAKTESVSITASLAIPTRTLAPVTISRSLTAPTTGTGHQEARAATGTLIFYNGSSTPQYVAIGSVFTGIDGVKVTTVQSITVPAANLPAIGSTAVQASAIVPGSLGNIAAFDVNIALSPVLKVRNEAPFNNGRDARTYRAVAPQDVQSLTSTVNETVTQAFTTAFSLQPGEAAMPTHCHTTTTPNHKIGDEAQSVTLTTSKTCSAIVYNSQQVERLATAAFTQTKPAANYHIVGSVQTTLQSVTPFTVALTGKWSYIFTQDYEQHLAEQIAGDTPAKAKAMLLKTGTVVDASVPETLPPAMYITFLVLVG